MKIMTPTVMPASHLSREESLALIERAGRTCYKSEDKMHDDSAPRFIKNVVKSGHLSVIEHVSVSFRIWCSRACSHQIVRHRIASYSQQSQRYVKEGDELSVVVPPEIAKDPKALAALEIAVDSAAETYHTLVEVFKQKPEDARYILPNCVVTELVMTANLREWLHFIELRSSMKAQWEIRDIAQQIKIQIEARLPELFGGSNKIERKVEK